REGSSDADDVPAPLPANTAIVASARLRPATVSANRSRAGADMNLILRSTALLAALLAAAPIVRAQNDDCATPTVLSGPGVTATAGATYMLQIGSSGGGGGGPGTFTIDLQGIPANDDCASALSITGMLGATYDSTVATNSPEGAGHAGCVNVGTDLWFEWTAP